MIVYKGRRFVVRTYEYEVGSLLTRYATKALLASAANAALRGSLDAAKTAIPHVTAHKLATTIARKLSSTDLVLYWTSKMIGESILQLHEGNAVDESIKSYEYDEYQPITGTQLNSAGQITIAIEYHDQFLHLHNSYLLTD